MHIRKANAFLLFSLFNLAVLALLFTHGEIERHRQGPVLLDKKKMVETLGLTDICLFTDARYTRNPAVADRSSAFQDNPLALDYFPSGSILPIPPHLRDSERDRKAEKHP